MTSLFKNTRVVKEVSPRNIAKKNMWLFQNKMATLVRVEKSENHFVDPTLLPRTYNDLQMFDSTVWYKLSPDGSVEKTDGTVMRTSLTKIGEDWFWHPFNGPSGSYYGQPAIKVEVTLVSK
jgi:hypothetical protein